MRRHLRLDHRAPQRTDRTRRLAGYADQLTRGSDTRPRSRLPRECRSSRIWKLSPTRQGASPRRPKRRSPSRALRSAVLATRAGSAALKSIGTPSHDHRAQSWRQRCAPSRAAVAHRHERSGATCCAQLSTAPFKSQRPFLCAPLVLACLHRRTCRSRRCILVGVDRGGASAR